MSVVTAPPPVNARAAAGSVRPAGLDQKSTPQPSPHKPTDPAATWTFRGPGRSPRGIRHGPVDADQSQPERRVGIGHAVRCGRYQRTLAWWLSRSYVMAVYDGESGAVHRRDRGGVPRRNASPMTCGISLRADANSVLPWALGPFAGPARRVFCGRGEHGRDDVLGSTASRASCCASGHEWRLARIRS